MTSVKERISALEVRAVHRADGTILLDNACPLPPVEGTIPARLAYWARLQPDSTWLSDDERILTYGEAEERRRHYAGRLLALDLSIEAPLLILGENGIEHALMMLAASSVGTPVAVVSPAYVAQAGAPWAKFARVLDQVRPGLILADDKPRVIEALGDLEFDVRVESLKEPRWIDAVPGLGDNEREAAEKRIGPESVAKLLFTSGSTGVPKAVSNTQRMMVSNMLAIAQVWPFLAERPPMMVDWLPWNHTFGGNCCFDIALWFGGHLHVDDGKPAPPLIGRTVAALRRYSPTIYFNVPLGYELLLGYLEADRELAKRFFGGLDFAFNAGAAMPAAVRERLEKLWFEMTGREPVIVGGYGSTETAPFSAVLPFDTPYAANLGIPIPGTTIKLVPEGEAERYELRVRGPNVTPGYWGDPAATAVAFDEEGFYRIGDAARFADRDDPSQGIVFDGRVTENFKLLSGTFVNVGGVRLALISAGDKLISDAVITGEGRNDLGALVFPNEAACREFLGGRNADQPLSASGALAERLSGLIAAMNRSIAGSSMRVARFLVLDQPPCAAHDEITDKGYINQRRTLACRADKVEELYRAGRTV